MNQAWVTPPPPPISDQGAPSHFEGVIDIRRGREKRPGRKVRQPEPCVIGKKGELGVGRGEGEREGVRVRGGGGGEEDGM